MIPLADSPPVQDTQTPAMARPVPFKPVNTQTAPQTVAPLKFGSPSAPVAPPRAAPSAPVAPATPSPTAPSIPLATSQGAAPYANAQATVPGSNTDYLGKTITPGAGVDRLALATSNLKNYNEATDPEYKASINEAAQGGAAAGQIGSGMLRTRIGDLALARTRDLSTQGTKFLNDATSGSIEDSYKNIGIAEDQQKFQAGEQQTAFDQAQRQTAMDEALRSGDFQRYYQLLQAGYQGNPSDTQLALAGNAGAQASDAGKSAGTLAGNAVLAGRKSPYGTPLSLAS